MSEAVVGEAQFDDVYCFSRLGRALQVKATNTTLRLLGHPFIHDFPLVEKPFFSCEFVGGNIFRFVHPEFYPYGLVDQHSIPKVPHGSRTFEPDVTAYDDTRISRVLHQCERTACTQGEYALHTCSMVS